MHEFTGQIFAHNIKIWHLRFTKFPDYLYEAKRNENIAEVKSDLEMNIDIEIENEIGNDSEVKNDFIMGNHFEINN